MGVFGNPDFREYPNRGDRWEDYLEPDEVLQWTGKPSPNLHFKWKYAFTSPAGLGIVVFSVWALFDSARPGSARADDFVGLLFLAPLFFALGAFTMALPFVDAWARASQRYALTNRRALIAIAHRFRKAVRAWTIGADQKLKLQRGELGSVRFATVRAGAYAIPIAFEFIPDAEDVHRMLVAIRADAARRP